MGNGHSAAGILYVVATPIGNLEDITLRALQTLRAARVIACEDTRRTRVLLDRHGIGGSLVAFHKFNEGKTSAALVARLLGGEDIALVSDGGTPAISDPGYRLVRDALDAGVRVTPVPGPCAFVAAVCASGLPSETVTFRGFLPHRAGERRRLIESIRQESATQVFYDSPRRAAASLRDLAEILGERHAAVARELTKRYESWYRGTLSEVAELVAQAPAKGEYCLIVEGAASRSASIPASRPRMRSSSSASASQLGRAVRTVAPGQVAADPAPTGPAGPNLSAPPGSLPDPGSGQGQGTGAVLSGDPTPASSLRESLRMLYEAALVRGVGRREALKHAARACGLRRSDAYRLLHEGGTASTGSEDE